ncbi:tricalbin-3-like [Olea europaea subsp. europaea]|uniref:Tricalbin-3-like n=1 Tax=Olea europaea subsp. europaea TaxID=158383 RepID=A0A8S0S6E0_OLEEU|nr:tricalbin-3-like [Olea europaea subsp. europaea]
MFSNRLCFICIRAAEFFVSLVFCFLGSCNLMILQSTPNTIPLCCDFSQKKLLAFSSTSLRPPCSFYSCGDNNSYYRDHHRRRNILTRKKRIIKNVRWAILQVQACINGGNSQYHFNIDLNNIATRRGAKNIDLKRFSDDEFDYNSSNAVTGSRGVVFDKLWTSPKRNNIITIKPGSWPQVPANLSMFLEKDLQRKESVEWVNMVLGKLWKVYRAGIENWITGLLQPVIDNLKKPDYVQRVEIKQFSLGDEPLSVRSVERRTSRRINDLQYQIGLRYTGGARMLLMLSLNFSILPIVVPVGVRDFDIDGEVWVKLRLIPSEPWVGALSWAFVSLPKIKFELSPFRLFNLMAIPVLSKFLKKLLTVDLPRLFVRPNKIVLDFQKGKAVGPIPNERPGENQEGNKDFAAELSVTLLDARKLTYIFYGKTDPYVVLRLGDQVIRSKKNSQTTVIGPPGEPIWDQDFHMLVANPGEEKLYIEVRDSLGFADFTVGTAEVDLGSLKDTVPTDKIVGLRGGWSLFGKGIAGEILLRLTYKAYVEDEEDERTAKRSDMDASDDELSYESDTSTSEQSGKEYSIGTDAESFVDVLAALLVSEEFRGIVTSETVNTKSPDAGADTETTPILTAGSNQDVSESGSGNSRGLTLFWLAMIASISVLTAINVSGSGLFNP